MQKLFYITLLVFLLTEEFGVIRVKLQEILKVPIIILRVTFSVAGSVFPYNCQCYKCKVALVLSRQNILNDY